MIKNSLKKVPGLLDSYIRAKVLYKHLSYILFSTEKYRQIQKDYGNEVDEIENMIKKYISNDVYNFNNAILPLNSPISPDSFFNILLPHIINLKFEESVDFYQSLKKKFTRLYYWTDPHQDIFTYWAHGFSYFSRNVNIEANDTVLDLGGYPGDFCAVAIAKKAKFVYTFEPVKEYIDELKMVSKLNQNKIIVMPYLVDSNKNSIDNLMGKVDKIDFIKMDIEGAEIDAMLGSKNILRQHQPKLAICTYHRKTDFNTLREIILAANPNYVIHNGNGILYGFVNRVAVTN